jgi:5-methylcytosine-specific restriction protein A
MGQALRDERARDGQRSASNPWRAWYKTAKWQKLRAKILKRDLYTCQRTGELLTGKHPAPNSPVVDHIKPHRGDPELFWDEKNLHAVSKAFHDSQKQREEQGEIKGTWY